MNDHVISWQLCDASCSLPLLWPLLYTRTKRWSARTWPSSKGTFHAGKCLYFHAAQRHCPQTHGWKPAPCAASCGPADVWLLTAARTCPVVVLTFTFFVVSLQCVNVSVGLRGSLCSCSAHVLFSCLLVRLLNVSPVPHQLLVLLSLLYVFIQTEAKLDPPPPHLLPFSVSKAIINVD